MTNNEMMKSYLRKNVIKPLTDKGFVGKYPHYRRVSEDCIELVSFQTNKYGGSFTIEVSAAFPKGKNKNYVLYGGISEETLTVLNTNERCRLAGMFDGWFYYRDVYYKYIIGFGKHYLDVSEKDIGNFTAPEGYRLVQAFNSATAEQICCEINRQLEKAFKWLNKFEKKYIK